MDGSSTERKSWPPTDDQRGLVCRWCGCKHFRVVYYARPTWGGRILRRREPAAEAVAKEGMGTAANG